MDIGEIHLEKNWLATIRRDITFQFILISMGYTTSLVMLELREGKKFEVEVNMNISNYFATQVRTGPVSSSMKDHLALCHTTEKPLHRTRP